MYISEQPGSRQLAYSLIQHCLVNVWAYRVPNEVIPMANGERKPSPVSHKRLSSSPKQVGNPAES